MTRCRDPSPALGVSSVDIPELQRIWSGCPTKVDPRWSGCPPLWPPQSWCGSPQRFCNASAGLATLADNCWMPLFQICSMSAPACQGQYPPDVCQLPVPCGVLNVAEPTPRGGLCQPSCCQPPHPLPPAASALGACGTPAAAAAGAGAGTLLPDSGAHPPHPPCSAAPGPAAAEATDCAP